MKEAEIDVEIEDVLSSIRRLVSQDSKPARVHRLALMQPVVAPPLPAEEDCLVLTPSQRIAAAEEAKQTDIVEELSRLESSIAEMEAAVADVEETSFSALDDACDVAPVDEHALAAVIPAEVEASPEEEPTEEVALEVAPVTEAEPLAEVASLIEPVSDLSQAEPVPVEEDAEVETLAEISAEELPACEAEVAHDDMLDSLQSQDETRETPRIVRPNRFLQVAHPVHEEPLFDETSSSKIDEESLRLLVAQLIREELRGVLGERITHNVRKLVRREIQRALAGNELE